MARAGSVILDNGERFPTLHAETVSHGRISLPDVFGDRWGIVLIYRAHW